MLTKALAYAQKRRVWSPVEGTDKRLVQIPHLQDLFERADKLLARHAYYCRAVERRLWPVLRAGGLPSEKLVEAINVAKVRAVAAAIAAEQVQ